MINTPSYKLAKFLNMIIKLFITKDYCVNSNKELLDKLSKYKHRNEDYCISFDVVSLFTNVPLNVTINLISSKITSNIFNILCYKFLVYDNCFDPKI